MNKSLSYFKYAIGEIVLVVLGILIALQVNNWNQNRIQDQTMSLISSNLHSEFVGIRNDMNALIPNLETALEASIRLSLLCDQPIINLPPREIDSLFNDSWSAEHFNLSQPVLAELMSSEKLSRMSDAELKGYLFTWEHNLNWLYKHLDYLNTWTEHHLHPYLIESVSYKNWDVVAGDKVFSQRSRLIERYDEIFNSLEFENLIQNRIYWLRMAIKGYKSQVAIADAVIDHLE